MFLICFSLNVNASDIGQRSSLVLETSVDVPISFVERGSNPSLQYLILNYSWIPETDYRQKFISYESSPSGKMTDDILTINHNKLEDFDLNVKFETLTYSQQYVINDKINFPLKRLNSSVLKYTLPTEKIDVNNDIRNQASELAAGEDDLYVVVFKLADWVTSNIEYNLSSATAEASLPSSWVLKNRYGVCDELSNLFISMCRSLGIPARFVSGIAYSDDPQFESSWGPHGWAEVYFPGYGWVPFDPTYNQLGFVDATHIKFDDHTEGNKDALSYVWLGKNLDVVSGKIVIDGRVITKGNITPEEYSIDLSFMKNEVSLDSYNVIKAIVQNNKDYYITTNLKISNTEGIKIISEENQNIVLAPNEKKTIYWILKVDNLDENYIYTFPISIYSFKEETTAKFRASTNGQNVNLKTAENYISESINNIKGPMLNCNSSKNTVYAGDIITITCTTDTEKYVKFCIDENCTSEKFQTISKNISLTDVGFTTIKITTTSNIASASSYSFLGFNVLDEANVSLKINSTNALTFNDMGTLHITLDRESSNIPKNAKLIIDTALFSHEWTFESLEERKEFVLDFEGKSLKNGINNFNITLNYEDELGKLYSEKETIAVNLHGLTFFQKIYVWFNGLIVTL
jgi:hypothetical protein